MPLFPGCLELGRFLGVSSVMNAGGASKMDKGAELATAGLVMASNYWLSHGICRCIAGRFALLHGSSISQAPRQRLDRDQSSNQRSRRLAMTRLMARESR
jgi:hypothetical protein